VRVGEKFWTKSFFGGALGEKKGKGIEEEFFSRRAQDPDIDTKRGLIEAASTKQSSPEW